MSSDIFVNNFHLGTFSNVTYDGSSATLRNGFISDYRLISWLQGTDINQYDIDIVDGDSHISLNGRVLGYTLGDQKISHLQISLNDMIKVT